MLKALLLTTGCLLLFPTWGRADEAIALPTDPGTPVVELWYVDRGVLREPEVAIFASGRVRISVGNGALWGELDQEIIRNLVSSLLLKDGLKSLRTEAVQAELESESARTGLSCSIKEAGDTIIRVHTATGVYRIDGHAVGLLATRFPNCQSVQRLYSAQSRLENIRAIIMVGGPDAALRLAKVAQLQIQTTHGETINVTPENLVNVRSLADGTRFCQFVVQDQSRPAVSPRVISVFESPGEIPRVSVLPDGPSLR